MGFDDDIRTLDRWLRLGGVYDEGDGCQFVLALCELTANLGDVPEADRSFDRMEIVSQWKTNPDRITPESLRRSFKAATDFMRDGMSRYHKTALDSGSDHMFRLADKEGGGAGRRSMHYLERIPINEGYQIVPFASPDPEHDEDEAPASLRAVAVQPARDDPPSHCIQYWMTPRDEIVLSMRGRAYFGRDDVRSGSLRRKLLIAAMSFDMIVVSLSAISTILLLTFSNGPVTAKHLGAIISTIALGLLLYLFTIKPFLKLANHRIIIMQDTWLRVDETPAVLEKVQDPDHPGQSMMRVSRYESTCGICGSSVRLRDGGAAWPDRLVGACVNSSLEHVYSFDRFSLVGLPLRVDMLHARRMQHVRD